MKLTVAAVLAGSLLPGTLASPPVLGDANPAVWAQSLQESRRSDSSRGSPVPRGLEKRDWSPPSNLASPLKQVWDHCLATYSSGLFGFRNFGWDQLVANNGNINFCVRWDSSRSVSESERAQIEQKYIEEYEKCEQFSLPSSSHEHTDPRNKREMRLTKELRVRMDVRL